MSTSRRRLTALVTGPARGPHLVIAFVVLLGISWVFANPPGYAPDEPAHYSKALSVGRGVWVAPDADYGIGPGFGPRQLRWINKVATVVHHPPHMAPDRFACSIFNPRRTARCLYEGGPPAEAVPRLTYVGTYEPYLYLPAGLAMRAADDAFTAVRLGRLALATISLFLLALAAAVLWKPHEWGFPLVGLVAATTPMVLFLSSELAPSGPEVSASICFMAVVLRLARTDPPTARVWVAGGVSGAVLAMSRSLGPFFLAADLMVLLLIVGPREAWRKARAGGKAALGAVAALVFGVTANVAWGLTVQAHPGLDLTHAWPTVGIAIGELGEIVRQGIGMFGWQDVAMPRVATNAWAGMGAALVAVGFVVGQRRQRLTLAAVAVGCVVGTIGMAVFVVQPRVYGFPLFGRYFLPLWLVLPLVAGEIVFLNRHRLGRLGRALLPVVTVVAATVHLSGWWTSARRYAVSEKGPTFFLGHSEWAPDGGWAPWVALMVAAVACLVWYGVGSVGDGDEEGLAMGEAAGAGVRSVALASQRENVPTGTAP
ncbi:MAG: DUF2142 domain-containing protein [Actinomycetota bacterium]|nr:DUF2142 domain-containing protein [Actinomycetota bacterium]